MKLNKNLIVLLAVFMLILSAGAVSADDAANSDDGTTNIGEATATDESGDADDDVAEDTGDADDSETDDIAYDESDGSEFNETEEGLLVDAVYAEGSDSVNESDHVDTTSNLDKNVAGNPVLILLAAITGIGLTTLKRRY